RRVVTARDRSRQHARPGHVKALYSITQRTGERIAARQAPLILIEGKTEVGCQGYTLRRTTHHAGVRARHVLVAVATRPGTVAAAAGGERECRDQPCSPDPYRHARPHSNW